MKAIAIVSHYSMLTMRTGMVKLVNQIAQSLSEDYRVDIITLRDTNMLPISEGNVTHYRGRRWLNRLNMYDIVIVHPPFMPQVIARSKKLVYLIDSAKDIGGRADPSLYSPHLTVFTTKYMQKMCNYDGKSIVLHPVVYQEEHKINLGDNITLIGMSPNKGSELAMELAESMPDKRFIGVRSGFMKQRQRPKMAHNFRTVEEVKDMRYIWYQTRLLISPSVSEQYGTANVEALNAGIPVIAFKCPGTEEALGKGAVLMDTLNKDDWIKAIEKFDNEEYYKKMQEKALKQASKVDSRKELARLKKELSLL